MDYSLIGLIVSLIALITTVILWLVGSHLGKKRMIALTSKKKHEGGTKKH